MDWTNWTGGQLALSLSEYWPQCPVRPTLVRSPFSSYSALMCLCAFLSILDGRTNSHTKTDSDGTRSRGYFIHIMMMMMMMMTSSSSSSSSVYLAAMWSAGNVPGWSCWIKTHHCSFCDCRDNQCCDMQYMHPYWSHSTQPPTLHRTTKRVSAFDWVGDGGWRQGCKYIYRPVTFLLYLYRVYNAKPIHINAVCLRLRIAFWE